MRLIGFRKMIILAAITFLLPSLAWASAPVFKAGPVVSPNPNPRAPLAAVLRFTADQPVTSTVAVTEGDRKWTWEFDETYNPEKGIPLLGMRQGKQHSFTISIKNKAGESANAPAPLAFTTPMLPRDIKSYPPLKITVNKPEKLEPGFTVVSSRREQGRSASGPSRVQQRFNTTWGQLQAFDNDGEIVWVYQSDRRIAGHDRLPNGNFIYVTTDFCVTEIDMLGNKIREWYAAGRPQGKREGAIPVDIATLHHQPTVMPNGNIVMMGAFAKEIDNYYTSELDANAPRKKQKVMGDVIVEFDQEGKILWSWNTFDYIDPFFIGFGTLGTYWPERGWANTLDWTHGNAVSYDETTDAFLASFRHLNAVICIDRKTREIRWFLTDPIGVPDGLKSKLLKPIGDTQWPYALHNPRRTPEGTVVLFDNGTSPSRPFDGRPMVPLEQTFCRAVEYKVDEKNMTVSQVWASALSKAEEPCISRAMGDAQYLPQTGNILTILGTCLPNDRPDVKFTAVDMDSKFYWDNFIGWTAIREYSRMGGKTEMIREIKYDDPDQLLNWQLYGGMKVHDLYGPKAVRK